jgi:hypothetical protein
VKYLLLAFLLLPAPPRTIQYAVRFSLDTKPTTDVPAPPTCHISVLLSAESEGAATVNALMFIQSWASVDAQNRLKFYDVCKKE